MKRILIVNVNWLGDTLFATPFIRAIRDKYPESYIAILTHPRCIPILNGNPNINEIIIYDEKKEHKSLFGKFVIIGKLKSKKFDTAFILRKSLTRAMILFLSKIPERIGYNSLRSGFLLTKKIPLPSKDMHKVEHFLQIARHIGIEPKHTSYEFFVSEKDKDKAAKALQKAGVKEGEDFIVLNAGGNWDLKRWPAERFARLGDEIIDKFGMKVVLTGAEKDMALAEHLSNLMKHKNKTAILAGKTDLKTLGAIFKKARLVISNDSGPMHIAVSVRTPVISLFGPTSHAITGPYGNSVYKVLFKDIGCNIPCYKLSCEDNKCMKAIDVEDVLEAIKGMIKI